MRAPSASGNGRLLSMTGLRLAIMGALLVNDRLTIGHTWTGNVDLMLTAFGARPRA
jgi:hypothetical protein